MTAETRGTIIDQVLMKEVSDFMTAASPGDITDFGQFMWFCQ